MEFIQGFLAIMATCIFFGFVFTIQNISFLSKDVKDIKDKNYEIMRELRDIKYKMRD